MCGVASTPRRSFHTASMDLYLIDKLSITVLSVSAAYFLPSESVPPVLFLLVAGISAEQTT